MLRNMVAGFCGGLFGLGLVISGMTDTARVIGWLDVFGDWDPTLAFVLGGAILPMALAWQVAARHGNARLVELRRERDGGRLGPDLILGSLLFGAGWGLAGLCPGPAVAVIGFGGIGAATFLLAMIAGMVATPAIRARIGWPIAT